MEQKKQKIIIIGGGVAGLTAGIYAQKAGFDSEIYEKHAIMGGQCTGWWRKGFYIDNCIHWLTSAKPNFPEYKMWKEIGFLGDANGNEIPCRQHQAFYTSELNGQKITLWCDLERAQKEMLSLSPQDKRQIKSFFRSVRACRSLHFPLYSPLDMMSFFELLKIGFFMIPIGLTILKYKKTSLEDLGKKFKHPLLKKIFTEYLPKNYLAYVFACAYGTIAGGGGGFPAGGSSKVIERMTEIYSLLGGKFFVNSPAKKILIEEKKATALLLEDGKKIEGDFFIPTCDPHYLFHNLLDKKYAPQELKNAFKDKEAYELGSTFQVAYEYDGETNEIGMRTYFECEPFEFAGQIVTRINMKNYNYEKEHVPQGRNLIQVKILQDEQKYLYWRNLYQNDKAEYERQKKQAAQEILRRIEERVPSAKGKMKILDIWTPYTYTRYTNAYRGVYMGYIITKKCKFLRLTGKIKELQNVFLAGQWLTMPSGLPMATTSGKFAVQRILRALGKKFRIDP